MAEHWLTLMRPGIVAAEIDRDVVHELRQVVGQARFGEGRGERSRRRRALEGVLHLGVDQVEDCRRSASAAGRSMFNSPVAAPTWASVVSRRAAARVGADLPIGDDERDPLRRENTASQVFGQLVEVVGVEIDLGLAFGVDVPLEAVEREIGRPAAKRRGVGRAAAAGVGVSCASSCTLRLMSAPNRSCGVTPRTSSSSSTVSTGPFLVP